MSTPQAWRGPTTPLKVLVSFGAWAPFIHLVLLRETHPDCVQVNFLSVSGPPSNTSHLPFSAAPKHYPKASASRGGKPPVGGGRGDSMWRRWDCVGTPSVSITVLV